MALESTYIPLTITEEEILAKYFSTNMTDHVFNLLWTIPYYSEVTDSTQLLCKELRKLRGELSFLQTDPDDIMSYNPRQIGSGSFRLWERLNQIVDMILAAEYLKYSEKPDNSYVTLPEADMALRYGGVYVTRTGFNIPEYTGNGGEFVLFGAPDLIELNPDREVTRWIECFRFATVGIRNIEGVTARRESLLRTMSNDHVRRRLVSTIGGADKGMVPIDTFAVRGGNAGGENQLRRIFGTRPNNAFLEHTDITTILTLRAMLGQDVQPNWRSYYPESE